VPESKPKHVRGHPVWNGEYVSLFDRDDYTFRKCVACGRSFEGAAGRVALAKKRGVCPACEKQLDQDEIERLTQVALASDREQYRRSKHHPL
jgi:Zn ribbon nucleic-acid-binding protein